MLALHGYGLPVRTLWEILAEAGLPASAQHAAEGAAVSLFDPCSARLNPGERQAVRTLLGAMGYTVEELSGDGSEARCCGFGGLAYAVDRDYARSIADARLEGAEHEVVTYCSNCRDVFAARGADAVHLLDLLLGHGDSGPRPCTRAGNQNRREGIYGGGYPAVPEGCGL